MSHYLDYLTTPNDELEIRIHQVAKDALVQYQLEDADVQEIHESSIALIGVIKLRVTPKSGSDTYLLNIHCRLPYWGVNSSRASIQSYIDWLLYLHRESDFVVQEPLPNRAGHLVSEISIPGDDEPIYATLHRWVPGEDLPNNGRDHLERVGAILAELHLLSARWDLRDGFVRPEYTAEDLYAPLAFLGNASDEGRIAPADSAVLSEVANRVTDYLVTHKRTSETWGVLHGDFNPSACVLYEGRLNLIDFDDCCLGFYIADIGNAFKGSLRRDPVAAGTFLRGYESVSKLPDDHLRIIEGFILAAWIRNWARWREPDQTFYNLPECVANECRKYLDDEPFLA